MECNGSGHCLVVDNLLICKHDCKLTPCPNFPICDTACPRYILDFNSGVCFGCFKVDKLEFQEEKNWTCPICTISNKISVKLPKCSHKLCMNCVKRIYYPDFSDFPANTVESLQEPKFPYPDQEDDYFNSIIPEPKHSNSSSSPTESWVMNYDKKLEKWRNKWYRFLYKREVGNSENLGADGFIGYIRHCPFCRS